LTLIQQAMEQSKTAGIQSEADWRWGIITYGRFSIRRCAGFGNAAVEVPEEGPEELLNKAEQNYGGGDEGCGGEAVCG